MIKFGISSACLYPQLTEDAVKLLAEHRVGVTEIFFNSFSELKSDYIGSLRRILIPAGLSVEAIHPFTSIFEPLLLFSNYERRFEDSLDEYRRYFEAAQLLKCRRFILHGDRAEKNTIDEREYFERFYKICECAKAYGVTVLQENCAIYRSRSTQFISNMIESLGEYANFTFDVKQCLRAGVDPFEMLNVMGDKVRHVHLSDSDETHDCLIPGKGNFDIKKLINRLKDIDFDGSVLIEVYRQNYLEENELFLGLDYIKNLTEAEDIK